MIPKVIHYCWMSGEPYPELVQKCINSWRLKLPDYEIIEWNSSNFDYSANKYSREAYQERKWAFVSDYVRLKVLYDYGGIYLDSDIEVLKKFDDLLDNEAFTGFEDNEVIAAWFLAGQKHHPIFKKFLDEYENKSFKLENGKLDTTPNPIILTKVLKRFGFVENGILQIVGGLKIYPKEYFCPKDFNTGKIVITENTYCIHYFNGGWLSVFSRIKHAILRMMNTLFGKERTNRIKGYVKIFK